MSDKDGKIVQKITYCKSRGIKYASYIRNNGKGPRTQYQESYEVHNAYFTQSH